MTAPIQHHLSILRRKQVEARTGISRSTIYDYVKAGSFPAPVKLGGPKSVGWIESEINGWLAEQIQKSRTAQACSSVVERSNLDATGANDDR